MSKRRDEDREAFQSRIRQITEVVEFNSGAAGNHDSSGIEVQECDVGVNDDMTTFHAKLHDYISRNAPARPAPKRQRTVLDDPNVSGVDLGDVIIPD